MWASMFPKPHWTSLPAVMLLSLQSAMTLMALTRLLPD
ncbi:hypothetical protein UUU_03360 (plasmid) [Klebsiella pneumoniae subsp. pneumoniae DSM 30104 = JCM 1662 = NBRC 14940]|nr:hypothetical protein UUU_03360 [Klebsiella pneumoniae subsp. pneumoniae DSM 30104 = JCM 1662 = NBRC 14940]